MVTLITKVAINVRRFSRKVPVIFVLIKKLKFFEEIVVKSPNKKIKLNPTMRVEFFHGYVQRDR